MLQRKLSKFHRAVYFQDFLGAVVVDDVPGDDGEPGGGLVFRIHSQLLHT